MYASAVKETVALAERITPPDITAHSQRIIQTQAEIDHINGLIKDLLGVEAEAKQILQSRLFKLQYHHGALVSKGKVLQKIERISKAYRHISLEPLTWRDAEGFPRLIVFNLTSPTSSLIAMPHRNLLSDPRLPENIEKQYWDVLQLLAKRLGRNNSQYGLRLTCRFEGLIPCEIRERIKEAKAFFGEQIFIIAEPGNFTINKVVPLPKVDPLIVGYDPSADKNSLWLIADFNTTPVEEAMVFHIDNSGN